MLLLFNCAHDKFISTGYLYHIISYIRLPFPCHVNHMGKRNSDINRIIIFSMSKFNQLNLSKSNGVANNAATKINKSNLII